MCSNRLDRWYWVWVAVLAASQLSAPAAPASPWPAGSEIPIAISGASSDLSGATWNPESGSLWVVRQNRQIWEYAYDSGSANFELQQTLVLPSSVGTDIEASTLVDYAAVDELYTLDEDNGRISRVVDIGGTPTVQCVWNLLVTNNGNALPPESGGSGPEGLEFVPDSNLLAAGFRFPDGSAFAGSTKGMGGLMFVGHQGDGELHVFDVNPDISEDFINHGFFLTSTDEIAGLHFDRQSSLMYVWHNPSNVNSLEISTLSSNGSTGTIDTLELYDSSMPSGNLEGIAMVGRTFCGEFGSVDSERALFMVRDGGSPNLVYFDGFPCDCTGAANETEFDACLERGDLGGGCACLDQDLDGDVDCDDFTPPISSQCVGAPECGNGFLEAGEECEDGNTLSGDCCSALCTFEVLDSTCGDPAGTDCDGPDSCDGQGVCQDNLVPAAVACGNPAMTECNGPDSCDGEGICQENLAPSGQSCGNLAASACNGADSCDAQGICQENLQPPGSACGDAGELVPVGATWLYLDDGSDLGTAWRGSVFADGSWASGPGQLGYGDDDEATVVDGGPSGGHHITTYFRTHFGITDPGSIAGLTLRILRDDGAVVYLNGTEVYRTNMPGGSIGFETTASSSVGGSSESTFNSTTVSPALLVAGDNVIAVEIHQSSATSSDISFDLELATAGDPIGTDCNAPDTCGEAGTCQANLAELGSACGDPSSTECDAADSCDGAGACQANQTVPGGLCFDGDACTGEDTCDASGSCQSGSTIDCDDGDACTADACDQVSGCSNSPIPGCAVLLPVASRMGHMLIVGLLLATTIVVFRRRYPTLGK